MSRIVFDIGGTNMRVARVHRGSLGEVLKMPTPRDASEGVQVLLDAIEKVSGNKGVEAIAGGMAGVISKDGTVLHSPNLPGWDGCELGKLLREVSPQVYVANDADAAGLGEAERGAGKDKAIVAYIGVGTGIGGSRIVEGKIDENALGFEPGHHILDASNGESFEDKVSGHALAEKYGKLPKDLSKENLNELNNLLAIGIYNIILLWSPEVVVLGGALINEEGGFEVASIAPEISRLNTLLPALPEVCKSLLGDEAGLYGAISLLDK